MGRPERVNMEHLEEHRSTVMGIIQVYRHHKLDIPVRKHFMSLAATHRCIASPIRKDGKHTYHRSQMDIICSAPLKTKMDFIIIIYAYFG